MMETTALGAVGWFAAGCLCGCFCATIAINKWIVGALNKSAGNLREAADLLRAAEDR